ncbi:MAG: endonuclease/exonuclease/phosphatase family protein [Myxococcaceae bacterium]
MNDLAPVRSVRFALLATLLAFTACGPDFDSQAALDEGSGTDVAEGELKTLPSEDRATTLDVGSWNVEWFGSPDDGPLDDALQQKNVTLVLQQLKLDLVGLVEVVDPAAFTRVVEQLPGYEGLLVTDPRVTDGTKYYSAREQKVALVFKSRFHVDSARVVVPEAAYNFGGRPPMEVTLSFTENGAPRTLVVVVAHFKAMANYDGWNRRTLASASYKAWLDATYARRWVLTIGDWNDDLDVSTYQHRLSPFSNFVGDATRYSFTTQALTASNTSTTATFGSTIDHHMATAALATRFQAGSAKVVRPDVVVPNYALTTSDHYPVVTRYDLR